MTSAVFQCLVLILVVAASLAAFWRWSERASARQTTTEHSAPRAATIDQPDEFNEKPAESTLAPDDPLAIEVVKAIQTGDLTTLKRLLAEHRGLAAAMIGTRTLLHIATDWPGHFPNGAATAVALIAAGANVNALGTGQRPETPLYWAASSDDIAVLNLLVDAGADIEAPGFSGTALADAVAFGQWQAAHRLVELGARSTLWQAAALGLMDRVEQYFEGERPPSPDDVTNAFWCSCGGGQRPSAEYLLERGADLNWIGHNGLTPLDTARRSKADEVVEWLRLRGAKSADELS